MIKTKIIKNTGEVLHEFHTQIKLHQVGEQITLNGKTYTISNEYWNTNQTEVTMVVS